MDLFQKCACQPDRFTFDSARASGNPPVVGCNLLFKINALEPSYVKRCDWQAHFWNSREPGPRILIWIINWLTTLATNLIYIDFRLGIDLIKWKVYFYDKRINFHLINLFMVMSLIINPRDWLFTFDHLYLITLISTFIFDHLHFIICIWSFTFYHLYLIIYIWSFVFDHLHFIICILSPADVFDCWALAILNRENVMRVASSRGLDICEYIWATLAKIKYLSFIKIRIRLINSRNIKGSSMQWSELQILGGM